MHRDRHREDIDVTTHGVGDSTVARTLAVLTFLGFALHYRYGAVIADVAAFVPADPLRHYGFPILASSLLTVEPTSLLVALAGFVLCVAPLERRIGGAWTWALFFWGHLAGIAAQLVLGPVHLATYRTWGPNAGTLAILVASAALARHFRRHHDSDFEVEPAPAPRGAWFFLALYVGGTLVAFAHDRAGALGVSGEASIAGMAVGIVGAWTFRTGSSLVKLFAAAAPIARVAVLGVALYAGATHRSALVARFAKFDRSRPTVKAAGFESLAPVRREPSAAERKLDEFVDKELGARELVFAAVDPASHLFAFAGGAIYVSGQWYPAAMLWDDEGFSAAGGGVTVRVRKPTAIDRHVAVLVNGSPIHAWPSIRVSALRVRELAQRTKDPSSPSGSEKRVR